MGFGPLSFKNTGQPSLDRVVGEGETQEVNIYAHVQAPHGQNSWAGMDNDGTPLNGDSAPGPFGRGQEAAKVAKQAHTREEYLKR